MLLTDERKKSIKLYAKENPCLCFHIRKAARAITHTYDDLFKSVGITATQTMILNTTCKLGSLTISQLAEAMATDRTTITRNLMPLEREAYIKVERGQDKREREIKITNKGIETATIAIELWQNFQDKILSTVGIDRFESLINDLEQVVSEIRKI